jgi:hypothetical protein
MVTLRISRAPTVASMGVVVRVRLQGDALVGEIHGVSDHLTSDPIGLPVSAAL